MTSHVLRIAGREPVLVADARDAMPHLWRAGVRLADTVLVDGREMLGGEVMARAAEKHGDKEAAKRYRKRTKEAAKR